MTEVMAASAGGARETEMVAVASRSLDRAKSFALRYGIPRAYGSYSDLLSDPDVDAVYISTPNSSHVQWCLEALEAGKHVLCEKPLTKSAADAESLVETAARLGRVVVEGFMYRHNPAIAELRRMVQHGAVGELRLVRASWTVSFSDANYVAFRPELDGGVLMALGCYGIHAARLFCGEPVSVHGESLVGPTGVDVVYCGLMRFESGRIALFDVAFGVADRPELELVGTEGSLLLSDPWYGNNPTLMARRDGRVEQASLPAGDPYQLELEYVERVTDNPALARDELDDVLYQARALDALTNSAITVPPACRGR